MSEITPGGVMAGFWRWVGVAVFGALVLVAVIIGGQKLGFWLDTQNVQHQSQVIRGNYATQESDFQMMSGYITAAETATSQADAATGQQRADLRASALGQGQQACQVAVQLSIPLGGEAGWVRTNCANGEVSQTSPLRRG